MRAGDVIGELAVLSGGHRTATVRATSRMHLFFFFGLEAHSLGAAHPELAQKMQQAVEAHQG